MFSDTGTYNNRWNPKVLAIKNIHIEFDYRPFTKAGSLD
jgi:hypothetical protein